MMPISHPSALFGANQLLSCSSLSSLYSILHNTECSTDICGHFTVLWITKTRHFRLTGFGLLIWPLCILLSPLVTTIPSADWH